MNTVTKEAERPQQRTLSRPVLYPVCRMCGETLHTPVIDLGAQPSANAYLASDRLSSMEPTWPLYVYRCDACQLVQLEALHSSEQLFSDYAYFSSYSDDWLRHAQNYVVQMLERFGRDKLRLVIEIASNDGYLLQYFVQAGVRVLGIDPAANVAKVADAHGVPTLVRMFGRETAEELSANGVQGDLIIANNVLAHVPDINDFVAGMAKALRADGIITCEFPHLMRLIAGNQFDTIYHEHFSYLSLAVMERLFDSHGLVIFDVEELPTHGGSLRIYASRRGASPTISDRLPKLRAMERAAGLQKAETYRMFAEHVAATKRELVRLLMDIREGGGTVAAYGAPAKGNTLLNYCGIGPDLISFTVDRSPYKQGRWLPGTRIPIYPPEMMKEAKPDYVLILPWNLKSEIMQSCSFIREWGGQFIIPIPAPKIEP